MRSTRQGIESHDVPLDVRRKRRDLKVVLDVDRQCIADAVFDERAIHQAACRKSDRADSQLRKMCSNAFRGVAVPALGDAAALAAAAQHMIERRQ